MSTDSRDQASSNLEDLETYVKRLEQEWKSAEAVLTLLKQSYDQATEDDTEVHNAIIGECKYVIKGGAC